MSNGKRIFAFGFKRWLVEQARKPGASVAGLALQHGINANQLRRWMVIEAELAPAADAVPLLPVTIEAPAAPAERVVAAPPKQSGHMELEVFGARLKLHGDVDSEKLCVVLDALARRR
jgi:transposase